MNGERRGLTERQIDRAYRLFYGTGATLRMVAEDLGCGIYDLSPWLTAPAMRIARSAIKDDQLRRAALSKNEETGR